MDMTEKRFTIEVDCGYDESLLKDNNTNELLHIIDCCNLMNEQSKKIVELEKELYAKRKDCEKERECRNYYKNRCITLENKVAELNQIILDLTNNQAVTVIKMGD